jgi:hypothetical protein
MVQIILIAALLLSGTTSAWGSCAASKAVNQNLRVDSCQVVDPYEVPSLSDFANRYPQGFVESYRQEAEKTAEKILRSYRGAVLTEIQGENTLRYFLASQTQKCVVNLVKEIYLTSPLNLHAVMTIRILPVISVLLST